METRQMKTPWTVNDIPPQNGRTAIITGTGGIGYECALALAGAGANTILAGRNRAKGEESVARIKRVHSKACIQFEVLDLADLASVQKFAARMRAEHSHIDILINNAAVMALPKRQVTKDGFEMQFGTNHLGHFALTLQLLPLLHGSRITTVSSTANKMGKINFDDLQSEKSYSPMFGAYSQAKVANILFAAELQRRADAAGIPLTSNSAHPGFSRTDLVANGPGTSSAMGRMTNYIMQPFFSQSPADGALPELYAATSPEAHGFEYYGPRDRMELRGPVAHAKIVKRAGSAADAKRLWEISERLTGVVFPATV
jgi:NAD(P)-dependent dehydrogenase (short-subunit alcohol dehydrogenase family)